MINEDIVNIIKNEKVEKNIVKEDRNKNVWLCFTIGDKLYTLLSSSVKEILRDTQIFQLPFTPDYIVGVVNRYGDPYAVIDPAILLNQTAQTSLLFIVLNDETHTCLRITDVKDFYTIDDKEIVHFAESDMSEYFEGTILINGENALILKPQAFLERVGEDLAS